MKIRKTTLKDARKILKLLNESNNFRGEDKIDYDLKDVNGFIKNKINKSYVCEINNRIVGVFVAQFWETYIYLHLIGIDKKYQGRGIGTSLMNFLEKLAKKHKKPFVEIFTGVNNKKAQDLFKKLKYKRGKRFYYFFKKLK